MPKKVAFVVGTLQTGGIERSVTDWCLYLRAETDIEPCVICLLKRTGPFLDELDARGIVVEECKLHQSGFMIRFNRLLRRLNPDVVHSQVAFSMPWQVLGVLLSGQRRIIFTQQNEYQNWNPIGARLRLKFYFGLFFRFIHRYTCVSEKVRNSLCELAHRSPDDFIVISNSVNTDLFFPDSFERNQQREYLGLEDSEFVAGMVGRFSPQKGHQYLVEAARILKQEHQKIRILLVGTGELESDIRERVEHYGLTEYFIFCGRSLAINKLLQALDCFVLPSLWEGMPLALLEAMACGLPVIGTDVAGTREVIQHEQNGLLIPSGNAQAIADSLIRMKDNGILRRNLAERAVTLVRGRYSVAASMKAYLKLYDE